MDSTMRFEAQTRWQLEDDVRRGGRFVIYLYCISLLVVTFRRPSAVVYVPAGQSAFFKGLPYTLLSLIGGWWGLPWGPIRTLEAVFTNIGGGKDVTEEVMRHMGGPRA
jgi:hypothetical protein